MARFRAQFNTTLVYGLLGAGFTMLMLGLWLTVSDRAAEQRGVGQPGRPAAERFSTNSKLNTTRNGNAAKICLGFLFSSISVTKNVYLIGAKSNTPSWTRSSLRQGDDLDVRIVVQEPVTPIVRSG